VDRWLWICPWIGLLGAIVTLWLFGLSLLSALGIAFLLSCPAVVVWTLRESRRAFGPRDRMLEQLSRREGRP
jgi:hypothetical protein